MLVKYNADYFPLPTLHIQNASRVLDDANSFKIYAHNTSSTPTTGSDHSIMFDAKILPSTIHTTFSQLNSAGYTHVTNIPGPFTAVCYNARCFNIRVLDPRLIK
uniref:GrBNV_gp62-like protein n=1 Tax=Nilaparvata lugens endogenous nudivirus TaxID=1487700 RepID=X5GF01_9VIRU|nr:GrBNV_gp62-like protein [Nilaparvata lugens endogenous nudivirus]